VKHNAFKKGTTLVEVLVASLIMVIAVGALLFSYIPRRAIIDANKQYVVSQSLFEREFEKVRKLQTVDDIKKYLYHNNNVATPINEGNPYKDTIGGTEYSLYYADQGNSKPYKLISLGNDGDSYLKQDKDGAGNFFGAKVIQVKVVIKWTGKSGQPQSTNVIFRGQDAVNI